MSDKTLIPTFVEAQPFEKLETNGVEKALRECLKAKCEPVYMPQLVDTRIVSPIESPVWQWHLTTPSVRVTGRTKQGNPVVVYAHVPNYYSKPNNVVESVGKGLRAGAGRMPWKEFYRLLDLEDNEKVFVGDNDKHKNAYSGEIKVARALKHPEVIPFLGGKARAEQYFQKHQQVYNTNKIAVWHYDDLDDEPRGRVLLLGSNYGRYLNANDNLYADNHLNNNARFLGVRRGANGVSREAPQVQARENSWLDDVIKSVKSALEPLYR